MMEVYHYLVEKIDGDYAHLRNLDKSEEELKLVARAILPPDISEGTKLKYECLEYSIIS